MLLTQLLIYAHAYIHMYVYLSTKLRYRHALTYVHANNYIHMFVHDTVPEICRVQRKRHALRLDDKSPSTIHNTQKQR